MLMRKHTFKTALLISVFMVSAGILGSHAATFDEAKWTVKRVGEQTVVTPNEDFDKDIPKGTSKQLLGTSQKGASVKSIEKTELRADPNGLVLISVSAKTKVTMTTNGGAASQDYPLTIGGKYIPDVAGGGSATTLKDWQGTAETTVSGAGNVVIGNVVRGVNMPYSVSPTIDYGVTVTFAQGYTEELTFVVEGAAAGTGTASIPFPFTNKMSASGTKTIRGGMMTSVGTAAALKLVGRKADGTLVAESAPFTVCAHPNAVENGPGHTPVHTAANAGMTIDIKIKSDSGDDTHLDKVQDSEVVSGAYNQKGSFANVQIQGFNTGFQIATTVTSDDHWGPVVWMLGRYDNKGGKGSFYTDQLDIFHYDRCGMKEADAVVIPNSGYQLFRDMRGTGGTTVKFDTIKKKKAVTVGGYNSAAGPSASYHEDVTIRP